MNTYKVIEKSSGREVYQYVDVEPVEWDGMSFETHYHVLVPPEVLTVAPGGRVWTVLEFLRRMTPLERIATRERAKVDPVTFDFMDLLNRSEEVRSDDPDVLRGLNYLWAVGILEPGRAAQIVGAV